MKTITEILVSLFLLVSILVISCKDERKEVVVTREIGPGSQDKPDGQIQIIDEFYKALTSRDSAGLIGLMTDNARMYGTDPTEDWSLTEIKKYISDKSRDTSQKAVFTVKKRQVNVSDERMVVVDIVDVSTIKVPFRILTITEERDGKKKIILSEFSALVWNEDMKALEALFMAHSSGH